MTGALLVLRNFEQGCNSTVPLTVSESDEMYAHHRESFERFTKNAPSSRLLAASVGACVWTLPIDPESVIDFAKKVVSGEMIARGDAPYAFRSWVERNSSLGRWDIAMATLSCLRHHISKKSIASVYVGETSFRAVTTRRRGLKLPNTPSVEIVPTDNWGAKERQ